MLTRAFLASGFWITARYVFTAVAGIIVSLAFAKLTSKEVFGQYQFVIALLALFSVFTLPGFNLAAVKAVSQKKPMAVLEAVRRSFKASLLAIPLLFGYGIYLLTKNQSLLGLTIMTASIIFPFYYAPNTWYAYYEGKLDFQKVAVRAAIASFIVTGAVVLALFSGLNLLGLIVTFMAVSAAFSVFYYYEVRRRVIDQSGPTIKKGLDVAYGRRVTTQKFAYTLSESLPPLAVSFLLGHSTLALFQVANIFLGGVSGLIGALAMISLPKFFTNTTSRHQNDFRLNIYIGLLASVGYYLLVRIIFQAMYGSTYQESYILAQSLAGLPLVISLRIFLVNYFTARDKNFFIIGVYLVANLISLTGFWLVSRQASFVTAAATYLYLLQGSLLVPLLLYYFFATKNPSTSSKD